MDDYVEAMSNGGTGQKLTYATTVVSGVASLAATILSVVYEPPRPILQLAGAHN